MSLLVIKLTIKNTSITFKCTIKSMIDKNILASVFANELYKYSYVKIQISSTLCLKTYFSLK